MKEGTGKDMKERIRELYEVLNKMADNNRSNGARERSLQILSGLTKEEYAHFLVVQG